MNAWLYKHLPEDFNQLRTDLHHILSCIPPEDTDPWTLHIPQGIVLGAVSHTGIRLYCAACEWEATYPSLDLRSAVRIAQEHVAGH